MEGVSPEQGRLDAFIPDPTVFQKLPTQAAMHNQWAASSNYITKPTGAPYTMTSGSTAKGFRATVTTTTPVSTERFEWPPAKYDPAASANVAAAASYPHFAEKSPHLQPIPPGTIAPGLGGIDPTYG